MRRILVTAAAATALSGCAAIVEGTSQEIAVKTDPVGASCSLKRQDATLATIIATPGAATIGKTRDDITVACEKDGYQPATYLDKSGLAAATFGNLLLGGAIGLVIDVASGADNKYDGDVSLTLAPKAVPASSGATPPPVAAAPLPSPPAALPPHPMPVSWTSAPTTEATPRPAATVDVWRAERIAERYWILHRLAADGLLGQAQYEAWSRQNAGAFLLCTAEPPVAGLSTRAPRYEDVVDFLHGLDGQDPQVAAAERKALFDLLMPTEGPRAPAARPPTDQEALRKWVALLDRIRDEGLLPPPSIEAEKAAIEASRRPAG